MKSVAHDTAVRQITATLKGPVAEAFRQAVPALAQIDHKEFYDSVMGNGDLLSACLMIFQKRREAFAHLLVDANNREVHDDFVQLRCGRSVHDIVAMVVRSHAKRQFHRSLGGDPADPSSRANRLYRAINEYLIHDWQVALVPHYAPLAVERVTELGPAILDARDAQSLERMAQKGDAREGNARGVPVAMPVPQPLPPASAGLGRSKDEEYWWETLNDPLVRRALALDDGKMRETIAVLANIGDGTRREVMSNLGLTMAQAAVVLTTALQVMGRSGFNAIFGTPGKPPAVKMFADRLAATDQRKRNDLKGLGGVVTALLQQAPRSGRAAALAG